MRVLVAHNRYRSDAPSGENRIVDAEISLLREHGVQVNAMIAQSDNIPGGARGAVKAAPGPIYSREGVRQFSHLLETTRPDVVHVHNVFPLISPWVVQIASDAGVPVIQTVHNYRHGCVNGLHLRGGQVCTDCLGTRARLPALQHGCYQGSPLRTVPMWSGALLHRRTWRTKVDCFLALTPFMKDMLVAAGLPADRIAIRPTWVPDPGWQPQPGTDLTFVGRLDEAKGVDRLLLAWQTAGPNSGRRLRIIGDGPLADHVRGWAAADPSIDFLGRLPATEVAAQVAQGAYVVVPSRFFEGYPLVVAEAFGVGRPVLTVSGGSVGSIVDDRTGWVVDPHPDALAAAISSIRDDDILSRSLGARKRYETDNTPLAGLESLLGHYRDLAQRPSGRRQR